MTKIICIGKNYASHAAEMSGEVPDEPLFFMKPETALLPSGQPFEWPAFSKEVHYELEVVVRISRGCRNVSVTRASNAYGAVGLGLDFTARDLQHQLKEAGHPWEKSKAFDGSAAVGDRWLDPEALSAPNEMAFQLSKNGDVVQRGDTGQMVFSFDELIAYCSRFVTLEKGDLLFTGTPEGVGPISPGDKLLGTLEGQRLLECRIADVH